MASFEATLYTLKKIAVLEARITCDRKRRDALILELAREGSFPEQRVQVCDDLGPFFEKEMKKVVKHDDISFYFEESTERFYFGSRKAKSMDTRGWMVVQVRRLVSHMRSWEVLAAGLARKYKLPARKARRAARQGAKAS